MPDPILSEPFLRRPAPRCLTDRAAFAEAVDRPTLPRLRRVTWPLRASFERWGLRLLHIRSGSGH